MYLGKRYLLADSFYSIKMSVENNFEIIKTLVCTTLQLDKLYNLSNEFIGVFPCHTNRQNNEVE